MRLLEKLFYIISMSNLKTITFFLISVILLKSCDSKQKIEVDNIVADYSAIIDSTREENVSFEKLLYEFNNKEYKWGLLNKAGKIVVKPIYDEVNSYDISNVFGVRLGNKWGVIDSAGSLIVEPEYDKLGSYVRSNTLGINLNEKWGFVNVEKRIIVDPKYDWQPIFDKNASITDIKLNNKIGLINTAGKIIAEPIYSMIADFEDGNATEIRLNSKSGLIDRTGKVIAEPKYDDINKFSLLGIASTELGRKWGCINDKGKIIVEPKYDKVRDFDSSNITGIELNDKWGLINSIGEVIAEPKYDDVMNLPIQNIAAFKIDNKWSLINNKGKVITETKYDGINYASKSLILMYLENKIVALITNDGNIVEGLNYDKIKATSKTDQFFALENDKWGIINQQGKTILEPTYDKIENTYFPIKGYFVSLNGYWGATDYSGKIVYPISADNSTDVYHHILNPEKYNSNKEYKKTEINGKFGIANEKGDTIVKAVYDDVKMLSGYDSLIIVSKDRKFGLLDFLTGTELLPVTFKEIQHEHFSNKSSNICSVLKDCKFGFYDLDKKKMIFDPQFDDLYKLNHTNNYLTLMKDSKEFYLNKNGDLLKDIPLKPTGEVKAIALMEEKIQSLNKELKTDLKFDYKVSKRNDKFYLFYNSKKKGISDTVGNLVLPPLFDNIQDTDNNRNLHWIVFNDRRGYFNREGDLFGFALEEVYKANNISNFERKIIEYTENTDEIRLPEKASAHAYVGNIDKAFEALFKIPKVDIYKKLDFNTFFKHNFFPLLKDERWNVITDSLAKKQYPQNVVDQTFYKEMINIHMRETAYDWALKVEKNDSIYQYYLNKKLQPGIEKDFIKLVKTRKSYKPFFEGERRILNRIDVSEIEHLIEDEYPDNCFSYSEKRSLSVVVESLLSKLAKVGEYPCFFPPAIDKEIKETEEKIGQPLPKQLIELYKLFNGQPYAGGVGIFKGYRMFTVQKVAEEYNKLISGMPYGDYTLWSKVGCVIDNHTSKTKIPIAKNFFGDLLFVDLKPSSNGKRGQILEQIDHVDLTHAGNSILDFLGHIEQNFEEDWENRYNK